MKPLILIFLLIAVLPVPAQEAEMNVTVPPAEQPAEDASGLQSYDNQEGNDNKEGDYSKEEEVHYCD
ncbi:MAG: hypothetical protein OEM43_04885 [Gammaproteobacteria bacterium]|nr:hypothetical protein [Gammaproteobacteria bacterium]